MRSLSSVPACPAPRTAAWQLWSRAREARFPACARQRQCATCCKRKAGKHAPVGKQPTTAPGRNSPVMQARRTGRMAGSSTRRGHETSIIAIACCCRLAASSEAALTLAPQAMQLALRHCPCRPNRCGPHPGCSQQVDQYGDHALACPRMGLLARRAKTVERAWVCVAREAVGPEGCTLLHRERRPMTEDGST